MSAPEVSAALTRRETARQPRLATKRRGGLVGWTFLAPFALLFALCFLVPILVSAKESFFRDQAAGGGLYGGGEVVNTFVGVDNYTQVLTSSQFWTGMGRVVLFGSFQIPIMIGAALVLALLVDARLVRRASSFRLAYFLPFAIPGVVAALLWTYLYSPGLSPLNQLLGGAGDAVNAIFGSNLDLSVDFFERHLIVASMANMTTWTFTGYNMLIFLAALQAIPRELYEAARIDGASGLQTVRNIKIPMLSRALTLAVLLSIIGTVQLFNEPTVLKAVNPWMGDGYTPMMMAYNTMMGGLSPSGAGPAAAVSMVMALAAGLLAVFYAALQRRAEP